MCHQAQILCRQVFLLALAPRRDLRHLPYCVFFSRTQHGALPSLCTENWGLNTGRVEFNVVVFFLLRFFKGVLRFQSQIYTATCHGVILCCAARDIVVTFAGAQSKRKLQDYQFRMG